MGSIILCRWHKKESWVDDTNMYLLKYELICWRLPWWCPYLLWILSSFDIKCTILQCRHINSYFLSCQIEIFFPFLLFILGLLSRKTVKSCHAAMLLFKNKATFYYHAYTCIWLIGPCKSCDVCIVGVLNLTKCSHPSIHVGIEQENN